MTLQSKSLVNSFLNKENSYYRIASRYADDGLVVQQMDGRILWANPAYCKLMGRTLDSIVGRNPLSFCMLPSERPSNEFIANFQYDPNYHDREKLTLVRNTTSAGKVFWMQISTSFHRYDDETHIAILVCRDVSVQISKEQQLRKTSAALERLANRDPLTNLANRAALGRFLEATLSFDTSKQAGLLQIDMDKFKAINDTYGHSAGDAVLVHVADQLRSTIRPGDFAARMGGDEFVVVCPNVASLAELKIIGANISDAIQRPVDACGYSLQCRPSIGAALATEKDTPVEEILRRADFALYESKRLGRGHVATYNEDLHNRHLEEAILGEELTTTLAKEGLTYYFQPTVSLSSGKVRGFETLVRWQHPRLGMIPPDSFLPLARRLGLLATIDFGAITAALTLKQRLNDDGFKEIRVGLNGSEELLSHPDFFAHLTNGMEHRGITSQEILIELLETVVFDDMTQTNPLVAIVKRLHDAGFSTLLDDFGTGHAGLTHMAKLAVSGVKIDRSLTTNILSDPTSAKIIAMIIDLCADLGFYVVTEGIETAQEAVALTALGGDVIQGYWISKPMPESEVLNWLRTRPSVASLLESSAIAPRPAASYLGGKS